MAKEIIFGKEARNKILEGAKDLSEFVSSTLGPFGRNVILKREYNDPMVTKDGVTAANYVRFSDQLKDIGGLLVRQAARKTADSSGDGTTTTSLLSYHMMKNFMEDNSPIMPLTEIKEKMDAHLKHFKDFVMEHKISYGSTMEMLRYVSLISSNGDKAMTDSLMKVYEELGQYADIVVETSPNTDTTHEIFRGMHFEGGFKAKEFITDSKRSICELKNVAIVITDKKIYDPLEVHVVINELLGNKFSVLIISPEVGGEAMLSLTRAAVSKPGKLCVVKSPGINVRRAEMLEDISVFTGGQVIRESQGLTVNETLAGKKFNGIIGLADKVVIREQSTTIINGKFDQKRLDERLEYLQSKKDLESEYIMKMRYDKRIAGLTGGVGMIYIGGNTESEVKEKQLRMDDCIRATKSALEMGVTHGGGYLLSKFADIYLMGDDPVSKAMYKTFKAPIEKIWKNGDKTIPENYKEYLEKHNIIDPIKVIWDCVTNSMSVAYAILSTNAVLINDAKSDEILGDLPNFEDDTNT